MNAAERIERAGSADFQRAVPAGLAASKRIEVAEIAGAVCCVVGAEPGLMLTNRVIGLGLDEPVTAGVLDAVAAFFAAFRARHFVSGDVPGLEARGYTRGESSAVFERDVAAYEPVPSRLEVVEADARRAEEFGAVCGEASGTPPFLSEWFGAIVGRDGWHCFFAVDGETPVATGVLYAIEGGAWFGLGATLRAHRRRGAQSALLAARIDRARELGLTTLVASTSAGRARDSYRNVERAGFRLVATQPTWMSPA